MSNTSLKKANAECEYTPQMIEELRKCKKDPIYFINNYVKTQHPARGIVPFKLFPYQERMIRDFQNNRLTVVLAARQMGKCCSSDTLVTVKDRDSGQIKNMSIEDVFLESQPVAQNIYDDYNKVKFTAVGTQNKYLIKTPSGWSPIKKSLKTVPFTRYTVTTKSFTLDCADTHIIISSDQSEVFAKDLRPGDTVLTELGVEPVLSVVKTEIIEEMYDLELDDDHHVYYTNGILSHNTLTSAIFLLWCATFIPDGTYLIASKNMSHATEIASRIRFAYEELPNWLKCGLKYYNRKSIEFDNGSRIICEATTEKTGRGLSITRLLIDEIAFVNPRIQDELWASLVPTLSTGGSAIISSTPNGDSDLFAQLWRGATDNGVGEVGSNGFYSSRVYWDEHPERDQKYYDEMVAQIGALKTQQEVLCKFLSSDALLINSMVLHKLKPKPHVYEDMGFKFWVPQESIGGNGKTYLLGIDPATGSGADYSVIDVFEFPSMKQIAQWRSNEINVPLLYAKTKWILNLLTDNIPGKGRAECVWSFERNGIGEALSTLYMNDEKQPEYAELYSDSLNKYGVFTTGQQKINTCIQLKTLIERGGMTINSSITLEELKNFVAKGNSYDHKPGATGDAVSALLVIMRLLKRLSEYDEDAFKKVNEYVAPDSPEVLFDDTGFEDTSAGDSEPFPMAFI